MKRRGFAGTYFGSELNVLDDGEGKVWCKRYRGKGDGVWNRPLNATYIYIYIYLRHIEPGAREGAV